MKFLKTLGKGNIFLILLIAQLFVIMSMLTQKTKFTCMINPMSGVIHCVQK
jgi:hypothetical protein